MKKKLLIAFIVFSLLCMVGVAILASQLGNMIAAQKPKFEEIASESLGAQVTLGEMSVSIFPSARVIVDSAKVSNPDNATEAIDVAQVEIDVALMPLLSQSISINTLRISEATITATLEEEGFFIQGLPRTSEEDDDSTSEDSSSDEAIAVNFDSFVIEDATVIIKDTIADTEYNLKELNLKAALALANEQVSFSSVKGDVIFMDTIDMAYTADSLQYGLENGVMGLDKLAATTMGSTILASGELSPTDANKQIKITSDSGVDLVGLDPALTIFAPTAKDFGIHGNVKPNLTFALTPTGYQTNGTLTLSTFGAKIEGLLGVDNIAGVYTIDVNEANQRFDSESLKGMLNNAPFDNKMTATLNESTGQLNPFDTQAFGGLIQATTKLKKNDEAYPFESTLNAQGLKVEELIPAFAPDMPFAFSGTVESISGTINGSLTEILLPSLTGQAKGKMVDGLIHDLNLGKQVLASINDVPFIGGALVSKVPPSMNKYLEPEDTVLSEISGSFIIKEEKAHTEDIKVVSDFFEFNAKGTVGLDTRLDLNGIIYFSPEFSHDLAAEVKELEYLLDDQGRLYVPVKITGIPPEVSTLPDTKTWLNSAVGQAVKTEMKNKVKDLLKIEDNPEAAAEGDGENTEETDPQETVEEAVEGAIVDGIKGLFKKKKN